MNILSILQNKDKYLLNNNSSMNNSSMNNTDECQQQLSMEEYNLNFHNFKLPPRVKYISNYEKVSEENPLLNNKHCDDNSLSLQPKLLRQYTLSPHKIHLICEDQFYETVNEIIIGVPDGWIPVCIDNLTRCSEFLDSLNLYFDIENSTIVWYKEKTIQTIV